MNTNDLANRLKFLRAKANYTQSYVCSKIHLTATTKTACVCHLWIY